MKDNTISYNNVPDFAIILDKYYVRNITCDVVIQALYYFDRIDLIFMVRRLFLSTL